MRIFETDLEQILITAKKEFLSLKDAHIFLTGGTGYIGCWLLEGLCYANDALNLNLNITVLSRQSERFKNLHPHLALNSSVKLIEGDIRTFKYPTGQFTHAIHAATDVIASNSQLETFDVIVSGTRHTLDFCESNNISNVLLLSSGAVYGRVPHNIDRVSEKYVGAPRTDSINAGYGIGKLASEWLGTAYFAERNIPCKSARIFTQIGPYLALDKQFAVGNFIYNALKKQPFVIHGDGTPLRSYMYGTDLVTWLLGILINGTIGQSYNVGSSHSVSIGELAVMTAKIAGIHDPKIDVRQNLTRDKPPERYVPDISRVNHELGLKINVDLEDAITRTIDWFRYYERKSS
jgi:nucleoside-diphosphate-sugar epimerase